MAEITGALVGLTLAELQEQRAYWLANLRALSIDKSHSTLAHSLQRSEALQTLAEINYAIGLLTGDRVSTTFIDLSA